MKNCGRGIGVLLTRSARPAMAGGTAPEDGKALKVVVGIALVGLIALAVIEALECAHRVRRAGGLSRWWHRPTPQRPAAAAAAAAGQSKDD